MRIFLFLSIFVERKCFTICFLYIILGKVVKKKGVRLVKNLQNEMTSFLYHNAQINYFYYLHKGDGMDQNRNEYILDMLLYSALKSYIVFNGMNMQDNKVVQIINTILERDLLWNETIAILKRRLFMVDLETYNQVITLLNINIDDAYFMNFFENAQDNVLNKLKWIVYYLTEEMETLSNIAEHRRAVC